MSSRKWVEAVALMVHASDEKGHDVFKTIEPFRSQKVARMYATKVFRGFKTSMLVTFVPPGGAYKGVPRTRRGVVRERES